MASILNVGENAARDATIKRVAAYELIIEANTAKIEASRLELVAYYARAQAEEAMIATRLSAPLAESSFDNNPEIDFLYQVARASVQARKGARKLVRYFAETMCADTFEMDNEDTGIQRRAFPMQEISAFDEVLDAVQMAVEAVIPVEHLSLTDRFDSEGHRSDIIRTARAILNYYADLPQTHQLEEESRGAEELSGFEDIPIADVENIPIANVGDIPIADVENFFRALREADSFERDISIADVENFFRTLREGDSFEETREYFDTAQNGGGPFGGTENRGFPSGFPSYRNPATRKFSGATQEEDASMQGMREGCESIRDRSDLFGRRGSRASARDDFRTPQARPKFTYTLDEAIKQANHARTRQARQNQQNMSDLP